MIVGDFCLKENTTYRSCFLIAIVRIFTCVGTMGAAFYNQTSSLSFAFIPGERSEWAKCYSRDEKAPSYGNPMVQSKVKVHKILCQARVTWEI